MLIGSRRTAGRLLALLGLMALGMVMLAGMMSPAHAGDETEGGSGNATENGGACVLYGWQLVNSADEIVWQDSGGANTATDHRCGNSAYVNRNTAGWQTYTWTHSAGHGSPTTHTRNGGNAPLYHAIDRVGAGACVDRHDVLAVWYLQDDGVPGVKSWANYGVNPTPDYVDGNSTAVKLDRARRVKALKDAIDNSTDPTVDMTPDTNVNQDPNWWLSRIQQTLHPDVWAQYAETVNAGYMSWAQVIDQKQKQLRDSVLDDAGKSPIIFCWYGNSNTSGETCKDRPDWGVWKPRDDNAANEPISANCFKVCPPNAHANAGQRILRGWTATQENDYCFPPQSFTVTEYGWSSELWGWESLTNGGNFGGTAPYGWLVTSIDRTPSFPGQVAWDSPANGNPAPSGFEKSSFGKFWDKYCSVETGCDFPRTAGSCQAFTDEYNAAVNATNNTDRHAAVNLSDYHKRAMGQGKAVQYEEYVVRATAYCNLRLDEYWTRTCSGTTYFLWSGAVDLSRSTDSCGIPRAHGTGPDNPGSWQDASHLAADRPYNTKNVNGRSMPLRTETFQMMTNHCNVNDFSEVVGSPAVRDSNQFAGQIDSADASRYYSASAVSGVYDAQAVAAGSQRLPWGVGSTNKSANASFFNRVCAFSGKLSSPENNRSITFEQAADRRGDWTFFRDGSWHELVKLGYFTPDMEAINNPVVHYADEAPTQTVLTRDLTGTPGPANFNMRGVNCGDTTSERMFGTGDSITPPLTNFNRSSFANAGVGILEGCYNRLQTRAIWATDKNRPEVLTVRWRFSPRMDNRSGVINIGWGGVGGAESWTRGTVSANIDGMTWSMNPLSMKSPVTAQMRQAQWSSSGTGSVNSLDVPLAYGSSKMENNEWFEDPTFYSDYYYVLGFVRSIAE